MNLNLITSENVTIEDLELIQELDMLKFPNRVYKKYIFNTDEDNKELSYEQARRKLIRNIVLGVKAKKKKKIEYKDVYFYGKLMIHINKDENSICYIKNIKLDEDEYDDDKDNTFKTKYCNIDENKKHDLNMIMGIK